MSLEMKIRTAFERWKKLEPVYVPLEQILAIPSYQVRDVALDQVHVSRIMDKIMEHGSIEEITPVTVVTGVTIPDYESILRAGSAHTVSSLVNLRDQGFDVGNVPVRYIDYAALGDEMSLGFFGQKLNDPKFVTKDNGEGDIDHALTKAYQEKGTAYMKTEDFRDTLVYTYTKGALSVSKKIEWFLKKKEKEDAEGILDAALEKGNLVFNPPSEERIAKQSKVQAHTAFLEADLTPVLDEEGKEVEGETLESAYSHSNSSSVAKVLGILLYKMVPTDEKKPIKKYGHLTVYKQHKTDPEADVVIERLQAVLKGLNLHYRKDKGGIKVSKLDSYSKKGDVR